MVFQVTYDVQNGTEDRLPQLSNQTPVGNEDVPRNQRPSQNEGGNEQVCTDQRLPEYFHDRDTTSITGSGPRHLDSQRTVSSGHERTLSPTHERMLLLEDTGKELRKMADMYFVTRKTGLELRRIADAVYLQLAAPECHPPDPVFIEEDNENTRRRKNS